MNTCNQNLRYSCALAGAIPGVTSIYRAVPIIHSGPGCGLQLFMGQHYGGGLQGAGYISGTSMPCSNTYEQEIVFGGENRLREVINTSLEIMEGDFFVVLNGCTSAIIGDDVNAVIKEFEEGHPIVFADTSGFKGNTYLGYEAVWEAMIKKFVKPAPKKADIVNIFGIIPTQDVFWHGNLLAVEELLSGIGLKVNTFYTNRQDFEVIKNSSQAALNIFLSPYIGENIENLYIEKFGVPAVRFSGVPIGPSETGKFIERIGGLLALDRGMIADYINSSEQYAYDFLSKALLVYNGLNLQMDFAVIGDAATVIPVIKFLTNDFGQIPVVAIITDNPPARFRESITGEINGVEYEEAIAVKFIEDNYLISEELMKYKISYLLGSSIDADFAKRAGIHHLSISYPVTDRLVLNKFYAGYKGGINLVEDFVNRAMTAFAGDTLTHS